jgi:hypothetical protein
MRQVCYFLADSPLGRVTGQPHLFDCPRHDAARVANLRFDFDDRTGPLLHVQPGHGVAGRLSLQSRRYPDLVFTTCMLRKRNAGSKKTPPGPWPHVLAFVSMDMVLLCPCSRIPSALLLNSWQKYPFARPLSHRSCTSLSNAPSL